MATLKSEKLQRKKKKKHTANVRHATHYLLHSRDAGHICNEKEEKEEEDVQVKEIKVHIFIHLFKEKTVPMEITLTQLASMNHCERVWIVFCTLDTTDVAASAPAAVNYITSSLGEAS